MEWASFDAGNRITSFASSADGTATYVYDDADQLMGAVYDYQANEAYVYDPNGNRLNPGYTHDVNNRLLSDGTSIFLLAIKGCPTCRAAHRQQTLATPECER